MKCSLCFYCVLSTRSNNDKTIAMAVPKINAVLHPPRDEWMTYFVKPDTWIIYYSLRFRHLRSIIKSRMKNSLFFTLAYKLNIWYYCNSSIISF